MQSAAKLAVSNTGTKHFARRQTWDDISWQVMQKCADIQFTLTSIFLENAYAQLKFCGDIKPLYAGSGFPGLCGMEDTAIMHKSLIKATVAEAGAVGHTTGKRVKTATAPKVKALAGRRGRKKNT